MESIDAIVKKLGNFVAQPKLDGIRVQVHRIVYGKENDDVKIVFFSRNLLDISGMFPELEQEIANFSSKSFIAEGEVIAFDRDSGKFLPFQETSKRRRKYGIVAQQHTHPVQLFLFDLLFWDTQDILDLPHVDRRKLLFELFKQNEGEGTASIRLIEEESFFQGDFYERVEKLEQYFEQQLDLGLEGIVVKRPDGAYKAGKRNFNWIKLKRLEKTHLNDTIDCVVMGYYKGKGRRAKFGIGALLVGVYNKTFDSFESVCKIGTGLSDLEWEYYKLICDDLALEHKPMNFIVARELEPDVWTEPSVVVCVRADQISLSPLHSAAKRELGHGLALRFPRVLTKREDKSATDATTVDELIKMYKAQKTNQA